MHPSTRTVRRMVALAAAVGLATGACSSGSDPAPSASDPTPSASGPTTVRSDDLSCDKDIAAMTAKDTIERVGGLRESDYSVRFAQSTRLGVVALVEGDTTAAFKDLHDNYGVELVSRFVKVKDAGKVSGFQQVRDLVDAACA